MEGIAESVDVSLSKLGKLGMLPYMGSQRVGHDLVTEHTCGCFCARTVKLSKCNRVTIVHEA